MSCGANNCVLIFVSCLIVGVSSSSSLDDDGGIAGQVEVKKMIHDQESCTYENPPKYVDCKDKRYNKGPVNLIKIMS